MGTKGHHRPGIGNWIAPPRFIAFVFVTAAATWIAIPLLGLRYGVMAGFDIGALFFFAIATPLFTHKSERMRISACQNDANRVMLLAITGGVMLVILAAIASELMSHPRPGGLDLRPLIVGTLAIAWIFSNFIYALHYAHLFYSEGEEGADMGGVKFPDTDEPDYWDFVYFSFCLGMTFQTSDVSIMDGRTRRVVTLHCLEAFVFNLGVIAFTINVLGSH
ncbi:DUF1345 domain-containing protein [Sphingomonas sp.]|uniref:DUF1345 domain-containing protein n=1 Tax=Sphingomonas sp. TaxID=28214 RepID=UPI001B2CEFB0|nr:DUF1345 domain-containing protein [Sphingomonas sp.]MBO9713069.1 DUF1345 domain-containing protein [Sphingomonas sp.]